MHVFHFLLIYMNHSFVFNVVHYRIVFRHFSSNLRGDEGGGDTEVEGEEEREDCEQGVQVQHGHHFVLPQTCLFYP